MKLSEESAWSSGHMQWDRAERTLIMMMQHLADALTQGRSLLVHKLRMSIMNHLELLCNDQEMAMEVYGPERPQYHRLHRRQHQYLLGWVQEVSMNTLPSEVFSVLGWWLEVHVTHMDRQLVLEVEEAPQLHHALAV